MAWDQESGFCAELFEADLESFILSNRRWHLRWRGPLRETSEEAFEDMVSFIAIHGCPHSVFRKLKIGVHFGPPLPQSAG